jgi:hypothetical protein
MVTGVVTAATGDMPIDKLEVQSIASSDVDKNRIRELIEELRSNQWTQPVNTSNPTLWDFHFTPPMIQILQTGPAAQDVLLEYISDPQIKDQIIFLLGGVGDGNAVEPIIEAMATPIDAQGNAYGRKVNLAANLALTNITVGDVSGTTAAELRLIAVPTIQSHVGLHGGPNTATRSIFHIRRSEGTRTTPITASTRTPARITRKASFTAPKINSGAPSRHSGCITGNMEVSLEPG